MKTTYGTGLCLLLAGICVQLCCGMAFGTTVTNTNDGGPGSLREAIAVTPRGGTVDFALVSCPCTIVLTSGQLAVTRDLSVMGPGAGSLTISGGDRSRIFSISGPEPPMPGITVVLEGLKITNGLAPPRQAGQPGGGGGILNYNADLTVRNLVVSNNRSYSDGGGIANNTGRLSIVNTSVTDNRALPLDPGFTTYGGGVFSITGYTTASLNILNSDISRNQAVWSGGVHCNYSTVQIMNSTISENHAIYISGYEIAWFSTSEIVNSTISGNVSSEGSAAIQNYNATMNITNSTISGNNGALSNFNYVDEFFGSTDSLLTITNSTIYGNGAGVYSAYHLGDVFLTRTTLRNSIVAGSGAGDDVVSRFDPGFVSAGYNLIGNAASETVFTRPGDQAGTPGSPIDPRLEPLNMNGGATKTHALRLSSSAVDRGYAFGLANDQRGLGRPNDNTDLVNASGGDGSDIGAFEIQFPVAGSVSVSGRVLTAAGAPLHRGKVTLTDSDQNVRFASINPTGHYRFVDVPLGKSFTIELRAKRWTIPPQTIFTVEPLADLDLIAQFF